MDMYKDESLGNHRTKQRIIQSVLLNTIPHALLISGPKHTGKYRFLYTLATHILKDKKPIAPYLVTIDELYREGINTLEEISAKNPSSFNQFERKKQKKKSDSIGGDDIELATKHLYETIDGNAKIVIIRDIERMTLPASNKFLKILEEPPKKTFFFLTTSAPLSLLPTIISRCQVEHFSLLSQEEMENALKNTVLQKKFYSENEKKLLYLLSAGKSEVFEHMQKNEAFFQEQKEYYKNAIALSTMTPLEKMEKAESLAKHDLPEIILFLEFVLLVHREQLKTDKTERSIEILEKIDTAIQLLQQNGNKRLILENVLFFV